MIRTLALAFWAVACQAASAAGPFDVSGKAADWAVVCSHTLDQAIPAPSSPMVELLRGITARLDRKGVVELRAAAAGNAPPKPGEASDPVSTYEVYLGTKDQPAVPARHVRIIRTRDNLWFALESPAGDAPAAPKASRLDSDKLQDLAAHWPKFAGPFEQVEKPGTVGKPFDLPKPFVPGWFRIDKKTLGDRFLNGRPTSIDPAVRVLADQHFFVRLPTDFDPHSLYGLLVWVDAGESTRIHQPLWDAADELRLIIIAADKTGNNVPAADRYQLTLDACENAQSRYLIDPARIYLSGISGGGHIASHMWACFPDVFTGAAPVVGMGCYEAVPIGNGTAFRAYFAKPRGPMWKLLLGHRIAPLTGPPDFNYKEITSFARVYERDKVQIRVFEYPDMSHELPKPARFADALRWVDEPFHAASRQHTHDALAAAAALPDGAPGSAPWIAKRTALTAADPWSKEAWAAATELLTLPAPK